MKAGFRPLRRQKKAPGAAPGTLVHTGEVKTERVQIHRMDYDAERLDERELAAVDEAFPLEEGPSVTWLNVDGLHDVQVVQTLGERLGLHPLVTEDILSTGQRPKLDDYEDLVFIVLRMIQFDSDRQELIDEQLSLIVGPGYVVSLQERPGDVFEPVRERLRSSKGRIRSVGADYLAYALVDAVVDHYFVTLESLSEAIEDVSEEILESPDSASLERVHDLKRSLVFMRKSIWPLREVAAKLVRGEAPVFQPSTLVFVRDVYDHAVQCIDTVESLRDIVAGMHDVYLSSLSHRMNEVMKVLTIIATIFIPLTFVAGIYGMNFQYMPELEWRWGYFGALGIMALIAGIMLVLFRRKRWL